MIPVDVRGETTFPHGMGVGRAIAHTEWEPERQSSPLMNSSHFINVSSMNILPPARLNVSAATSRASQPAETTLPFSANAPRVSIKISPHCQYEKWAGLHMHFSQENLAILRHKTSEQQVAQAMVDAFHSMAAGDFYDAQDPGKLYFQFHCGQNHFTASCEHAGDAINKVTVTQYRAPTARGPFMDFTLPLQRPTAKRDASASPPRSPNTQRRHDLLRKLRAPQSRASNPPGPPSEGALGGHPASRFAGDEPGAPADGITADASIPLGDADEPGEIFPMAPAYPVQQEVANLGNRQLGEIPARSIPATSEELKALTDSANMNLEEQSAFEQSVAASRQPMPPGPSGAASGGASRAAAQMPPTSTNTVPRYDEIQPLEAAQKLLTERPNISFSNLFKTLAPDYQNTVTEGTLSRAILELDYFQTHVRKQLKGDPRDGERMRAKDVLANLPKFITERTNYEATLSGPDKLRATGSLNHLEKAVFGLRPHAKKVTQLLEDKSAASPFHGFTADRKAYLLSGALKFETFLCERYESSDKTRQENAVQAFLETKHKHLSSNNPDPHIVSFLGYRPALYKLDGDDELQVAFGKLKDQHDANIARETHRLTALLPEIALRLRLSKEHLFGAMKEWAKNGGSDVEKENRQKIKDEWKNYRLPVQLNNQIETLFKHLPTPAESTIPEQSQNTRMP